MEIFNKEQRNPSYRYLAHNYKQGSEKVPWLISPIPNMVLTEIYLE